VQSNALDAEPEVTGVHPYADKFPMLSDENSYVTGSAIVDRRYYSCTARQSPTNRGYWDVVVTDGSEVVASRRPMKFDFVGAWVDTILRPGLPWQWEERQAASIESSSSVYFVADEDGYIKIGLAGSVSARLQSLQTASRQQLRLVATMPGGRADERALHLRFGADHVRGEWFKPSDDLLDFIAQVAT